MLVEDVYYKYLVVLLVPVTVCLVIINWWGLKVRVCFQADKAIVDKLTPRLSDLSPRMTFVWNERSEVPRGDKSFASVPHSGNHGHRRRMPTRIHAPPGRLGASLVPRSSETRRLHAGLS